MKEESFRKPLIPRRRCSYRLPTATADTLARLARAEGRSLTSIMCRAIELYRKQSTAPMDDADEHPIIQALPPRPPLVATPAVKNQRRKK